MSIANTILEQLGGRMFTMMTGARDLLSTGDTAKGPGSLRFRVPIGKGKSRIVDIQLTHLDVYTVSFYTYQGKLLSQHEDIYEDRLRWLFERETGLRTSLTSIPA